MTTAQCIAALRARLIVSCQAPAGSPLHDPYVIARMAQAAALGGAAAVRIDSPDHIRAVCALCEVPVIGLHKQTHVGSDVYITPTVAAAHGVVAAGAAIVAVDATRRRRPGDETLEDVIAAVRAAGGSGAGVGPAVMADISTEEEGLLALDLGVDVLATTLSGYTAYSRTLDGPDLDLVSALARRAHVPVVCEGRVRTPRDLHRAFDAGAFAVVVGGAITGVDGLVRDFVAATQTPSREIGHA